MRLFLLYSLILSFSDASTDNASIWNYSVHFWFDSATQFEIFFSLLTVSHLLSACSHLKRVQKSSKKPAYVKAINYNIFKHYCTMCPVKKYDRPTSYYDSTHTLRLKLYKNPLWRWVQHLFFNEGQFNIFLNKIEPIPHICIRTF